MNPRFVLVAALVATTAMLGVVGFLAGQVSVLLAPLAVLAVGLGLVRLVHSPGGVRRRLREKDDLSAMWMCRSGATSRIRRFYRRLPSDPRCRLCLAPFRGAGRFLGIKPSPKNPNFCPG